MRYRCENNPTQGLRFVEVFKYRLTGSPHTGIDGPLACRWFERFEYEAGLLEPTRIAVPIPIAASWVTRFVANGIALYLGLRDANARGGYGLDGPFMFARSFCMDYCHVKTKQAQVAMAALEKAGSIRRVGKMPTSTYPAILWQLGGAA